MNRFAKIWHDPVWSAVIAGIVLLVVGTLWTYRFDWWPKIAGFTQSTYHLALSPSTLPTWVIGILCLFALPTIFAMVIFLKQLIFPSQQQPDWKNYRTDEFFKLRWRWNYFDNGLPYDLFIFCPHCDFQIYPKEEDGMVSTRFTYQCDECGKKLAEFEESPDSLENKVIRHIQHKLRNHTWNRE